MSRFDPQKDEDCAELAAALVAYALGVKAEALFSHERGSPAVSRARHIAMYLVHTGLGMSLGRVARAFSRDRSTVAHACRQIELDRDDDDFDLWLEQLTVGLTSVIQLAITDAA